MKFDHYNSDKLYSHLIKTFQQHFKLKNYITNNIQTTYGGEKLSWIKKYNTLFINKWSEKE
tara:strand:- start:1368 stop:1550 length:183 start_codon:yes stop_codon:yes gene_type:complete